MWAVLFTVHGASMPEVPLKSAEKAVGQEIPGAGEKGALGVALRTGLWRLEVRDRHVSAHEQM